MNRILTAGETTPPPVRAARSAMTTPLFSSHAFEPEKLKNMSEAYESVCTALGLVLTDDPATRTVAEKILEYARRGISDPATLTERTLEAFNCKT
jgi:hypothetical protein